MCNLYDLGRPRSRSRDQWEEALAQALKETQAALEKDAAAPKAHAIRKTDPGLVFLGSEDGPIAKTMRWGFHRPFNPSVNNARSEKLDGPWSEAWTERRRCLIPMSAFYEWQGPAGAKQTFAIVPGDDTETLWAAGIWEPSPSLEEGRLLPESYSMLTTASCGRMAEIHDRTPVLLSPSDFATFLDSTDPRESLGSTDVSLEIFRCRNPLRNLPGHEGPEREEFLPGFE